MTFSNILFNKIENGLIFTSDYRTFVKNNTISFSNAGIAVVYGPNGTGKTSLAKVFSGEEGTAISCEYNSMQGDYLLPNLTLPAKEETCYIGVWG